MRYDAIWYHSILVNGYEAPTDSFSITNLVFYPFYPLVAKALHLLTGLSPDTCLLLISNLAGLLMVIPLTMIVQRDHDTPTALLSVSLLSFYPASIFFSSAYTESLALLFGLVAFLALRQQRLLLAAIFSGFMLATRSVGIVMIPVLLMALWQRERKISLSGLFEAGLLCLIASSGLIAFMAYQWWAFGNPLLFSEGQVVWTSGIPMRERFLNA